MPLFEEREREREKEFESKEVERFKSVIYEFVHKISIVLGWIINDITVTLITNVPKSYLIVYSTLFSRENHAIWKRMCK